MIPYIASSSNPKIKWLKSLHKNSTRREEGVFVVEGAKEIAFALDGGYLPRSLFVAPEIYGEDVAVVLNSFQDLKVNSDRTLKQVQSLSSTQPGDDTHIYNVSKECYGKITYRGSTDGLLAVFEAKSRTLDELTFGDNPLLLVVESVEKPGNLGAIIRTADGVGADAVIVCDPKTDVFNPNVIRSSVGTVFTTQVVTTSSEELYDMLQKHEITAYGALLADDAKQYTQADFIGPTALFFGTEHDGLSNYWVERSQPITIPMRGENDSLNVSNAVAILAYEVLRQRERAR